MTFSRATRASGYIHRQQKKLMTFMLLSVLGAGAYAETPRDKAVAARQLVELLDYKSMFEAHLSQCRKPEGTMFDPAVVFNTAPEAFGGISPRSAYWPEIKAAHQRYQAHACSYMSADTFVSFVAGQFSDQTSLEDLQASLAFYSSPAGRRLQKSSLGVNAAMQIYLQENGQKNTLDASVVMQKEVIAIVEKYIRAPK